MAVTHTSRLYENKPDTTASLKLSRPWLQQHFLFYEKVKQNV